MGWIMARSTVLNESECWTLLRTAEVGRLAVLVDGGVDLFPVNFAVDHGSIVFRTAVGTKFEHAVLGQPVAFEADHTASREDAWSVVVKGTAREIKGLYEGLDAMELALHPWQEGDKPRFVRIEATSVTGRRLSP